jgi:hypothetical protein
MVYQVCINKGIILRCTAYQISKCVFVINYLLLHVLDDFWYKIPEDGNNAETCRSWGIEKYLDCKDVHLLVLPKI